MATDNIFAGSITCNGFTNTGVQSVSGNFIASGGATITGLRTIGNSATNIAAARVLTALDSGGVFTVEQITAGYAIALPTPTGAGLRFVLQLKTAGAFNVTVAAAGCTFEGTVVNDVTSVLPATGNTFTFVSGVAALGDNIEFISTSTTKYFARAVCSANGGITIA